MKTMNIKFASVLLVFAIAACGGGDKKAELEKLKQQQVELSEKIKTLEQEIALAGGDSTKKVEVKTTNVAVVALTAETFKHYVEVQGKLDGEENVAVYPEAMGAIVAVYTKIGQKVTKGQVLAKMDNAAQLEQLKALETQYNMVKETFERQERLWNQKIGSEMQFLQTKSAKETLESQIAATRKQISMFTITSPINGTIGDVLLKIGQTATPSFPAFRVVNFNSIKIVADVAEAYSSKINDGDDVIIHFPDLNKDILATVSAVSKYINPVNRTFQVEIRLKSESADFKANMIAVVKINDYQAKNTISIPLNYVQNDQTESFVFIADKIENQAIAKRIVVTQGKTYDGKVEILSGLKPGDKLITAGYQSLEDSTYINY